jgi:hypothetical protein
MGYLDRLQEHLLTLRTQKNSCWIDEDTFLAQVKTVVDTAVNKSEVTINDRQQFLVAVQQDGYINKSTMQTHMATLISLSTTALLNTSPSSVLLATTVPTSSADSTRATEHQKRGRQTIEQGTEAAAEHQQQSKVTP